MDDTHDPRSDGDYVASVPQRSCVSQNAVPNVQDELADDNSSVEFRCRKRAVDSFARILSVGLMNIKMILLVVMIANWFD